MDTRTPCGLAIPDTDVRQFVDPERAGIEKYMLSVLTCRDDYNGTQLPVAVPEICFSGTGALADVECLRVYTRVYRPFVDWLTYHDLHCDCRKEDG